MQGLFYILRNEDIKNDVIEQIKEIDVSEKIKCVIIKDYEPKRTERQNRYLWGWVYENIVTQLNDSGQCISLSNGGSMQWNNILLHEALKKVYLALPPILTLKGEINLYKNTANLTKKEFGQYLQDIDLACENWWSQVLVPPPRGIWSEIYSGFDLQAAA